MSPASVIVMLFPGNSANAPVAAPRIVHRIRCRADYRAMGKSSTAGRANPPSDTAKGAHLYAEQSSRRQIVLGTKQ